MAFKSIYGIVISFLIVLGGMFMTPTYLELKFWWGIGIIIMVIGSYYMGFFVRCLIIEKEKSD